MPEVRDSVLGGRALGLESLKEAARELIRKCGMFNVWSFYGDIGAGKTTLIKALCEELGVRGGMSSPTFSIVNEYALPGGKSVYHFDFYRLKNEREALDLGAEEYFDSRNYCFIEWPERAPSIIPDKHVEVKIIPTDATHRIIEFATHE